MHSQDTMSGKHYSFFLLCFISHTYLTHYSVVLNLSEITFKFGYGLQEENCGIMRKSVWGSNPKSSTSLFLKKTQTKTKGERGVCCNSADISVLPVIESSLFYHVLAVYMFKSTQTVLVGKTHSLCYFKS